MSKGIILSGRMFRTYYRFDKFNYLEMYRYNKQIGGEDVVGHLSLGVDGKGEKVPPLEMIEHYLTKMWDKGYIEVGDLGEQMNAKGYLKDYAEEIHRSWLDQKPNSKEKA